MAVKGSNLEEIEAIDGLFDDPAWVDYWLNKPKSFGYAWELIFRRIFDEAARLYAPGLKGKSVVVVGCGPGAEAEWLLGKGASVVCTDMNPKFLDLARKRLGDAASYKKASAEKLPFRENSKDIVYMCGVLHHVPDYTKAISESKRVAREGVIIINEPREPPLLKHLMKAVNWNTEYGGLETHRFDDREIRALLREDGWTVRSSSRWMYYPRSLNFLRDSKVFSRLWMGLLTVLNLALPFLGHQLNAAAWK